MDKITCITENSCSNDYLLAQQGQSILIEAHGKKILFDVAQNYDALKKNLDQLEIDINSIDAIVISHKDFDHSGSLPELLDVLENEPDLYINNDYNPDSGSKIEGNLTEEKWQVVEDYLRLTKVTEGMRVFDNIYLTKPLQADVKELALVVDYGEKGILLVSGCSHPGIDKLVSEAIKITANDKVRGIIGGLHLLRSDEKEITEKVNFIKSLNLDFIVPMHCSGYKTISKLYIEAPDVLKVNWLGTFGTGNYIELEPSFKMKVRGSFVT